MKLATKISAICLTAQSYPLCCMLLWDDQLGGWEEVMENIFPYASVCLQWVFSWHKSIEQRGHVGRFQRDSSSLPTCTGSYPAMMAQKYVAPCIYNTPPPECNSSMELNRWGNSMGLAVSHVQGNWLSLSLSAVSFLYLHTIPKLIMPLWDEQQSFLFLSIVFCILLDAWNQHWPLLPWRTWANNLGALLPNLKKVFAFCTLKVSVLRQRLSCLTDFWHDSTTPTPLWKLEEWVS